MRQKLLIAALVMGLWAWVYFAVETFRCSLMPDAKQRFNCNLHMWPWADLLLTIAAVIGAPALYFRGVQEKRRYLAGLAIYCVAIAAPVLYLDWLWLKR